MQAIGHAAQSRHAFTLAAGRNDDRFVPGIIFELVDVDQCVLGNIEHVELGGRIDDVDHAAALDNDLAPVFVCVVDDLLDAVHVGGKGSHDQSGVRMVAEDLIDAPADCLLGRCVAGTHGVCGVAQEGQNALPAQFGKPLQVNGISVNRSVVDLEVTGVDNDACRRGDGQGCRVHDAVVGLDEFDPEVTQGHNIPEGHDVSLGSTQQVVLPQLVFDNAHGQTRSVDGHIDLFQDIGKSADMILMSVSDHKALHLVDIFFQISRVRYHQIDTEHVVFGKGQTAVYDYDTVPVFKRCDIHPDLLKSAEGNNLHRGGFSPVFFFIPVLFQSQSSSIPFVCGQCFLKKVLCR